jgi:uncharacterized protein YkwD
MSRKRAGNLNTGLRMRKFPMGLAGLLSVIMVCSNFCLNPLRPSLAAAATSQTRVRPAPTLILPLPPVPINLKEVEELIWRLTNDARRQHGLPPVIQEATLAKISLAYSMDMLNRGFFSHNNPEGLTPGDRLKVFYHGPIYGWGENIWAGSIINAVSPVALAQHIMDAWLYSAGHRKNILNPEFTYVGIGIAANGLEIRATQLFANLKGE